MQKMISLLGGLACLSLFLASAPAGAAYIAYVSPIGIDSGDCSNPAAPCRQVGYAVSQVSGAGVVNVAPGEYISFSILNKAVDVIAPHGQAILNATLDAPPDGGPAASIVIHSTSAAGPIRIVGFTTNAGGGVSISGNTPGVLIEDCFISSTNAWGIDLRASAGSPILYVRNTHLDRSFDSSNGGGLRVRGTVGARVTLEDVYIENNFWGIMIDGTATTGVHKVVIRDTTSVAADAFGLYVIDSGAGSTAVTIEGSEFSNNNNQGIVLAGANVAVRVANSSITNNVRGVVATGGAKAISQGGNVLAGNTTDGAFTSTLPFK